ncbi:MAG: T9SS type A sorting domain-containing protein [Cytophagaceae bacterium]|nr:T9SS type A sorting domain-containing protein [Cytophagaceae bacterium]
MEKLKYLCALCIFFICSQLSFAQYDFGFNWNIDAYEKLTFEGPNGMTMPYRLLKPNNYDTTKKYPLVLMLHGKGEGIGEACTNERGINVCNLGWGGKLHLDSINKYPSFVVFPQIYGGGWSSSNGSGMYTDDLQPPLQKTVALLEYLFKTYKIDLNRVSIHGLSGGGQGVWEMLMRYPHLFASASPHSASTDKNKANRILYNPVWTVQGEADGNPKATVSITLMDELIKYGKKPIFTLNTVTGVHDWPSPQTTEPIYSLYPGEGHVVWPHLYNSPTWLAWMYAHNKNDIVVVGRTTISPGEIVKLGISGGFDEYEWSNGATTNEISVNTAGTYRVRFKRKAYFFSGPSEWSEWSNPVTITMNPSLGPAADAGKDVKLLYPANSVKLRGYGSGSGIKFKWTKEEGGVATISGSTSSTLNVTELQPGNYRFKLTVTDNNGKFTSDEVMVAVTAAPGTQYVVSYTLVNADTDKDIGPLKDGDVINLSTISARNFNIRANTDPATVGSVVMVFDDTTVYENTAPYALYGGTSTNYNGKPFKLGQHILKSTPYKRQNGAGTQGVPLTVKFTVTDGTVPPPPPPSTIAVVSFTLINADTEGDIGTINNGDNINLSTLPTRNINIRANTNPATVGSVVMILNGTRKVESGAPYTFFGDANGNYAAGSLAAGNYTMQGTAYTASGGGGSAGATLTINFTVTDGSGPPPPPVTIAVVSFTLINADTDTDIGTINEGDNINLSALPTRNLNIRANTNPATVGSVIISMEAVRRVESGAPYSLYGDGAGNYNAASISVGSHTLTGTPYSSSGGGGTAGTTLTVHFTVTDEPAAAMQTAAPDSSNARMAYSQNVSAYPNPINSDHKIQLGFEDAQNDVTVTVHDQYGNMIYHNTFNGHGSFNLELDLSGMNLNRGVYYVNVSSDKIRQKSLKMLKD